jgi:hypothetical protein
MILHLNPKEWEGDFKAPSIKDTRWVFGGLLFLYLILGETLLGFSRRPEQIAIIIGLGAILEIIFSGIFNGRKIFPLSSIISCLSISIILNFSFGNSYLWIPVFVMVASKYIFTLNQRHFFNPSLFGIVCSLLFSNELVSLAPAYQWYGTVESAGFMVYFVITAAILFFVVKINRIPLVISFLIVFTLQTLLRSYIVRYIIPPETLFIGALTSPAFYLFCFYMITDPGTSPNNKKEQIVVGSSIALMDLLFHLKFSLYTFFFAGISVAMIRFLYKLGRKMISGEFQWKERLTILGTRGVAISIMSLPFFLTMNYGQGTGVEILSEYPFQLNPISSEHSGLVSKKSDLLNQVDSRVAHVAKWVLSVGDAVATADVNNDGLKDIFLTQILKDTSSKAKLYLNKGNFKFQKLAIPDLEQYLDSPQVNGLPSFGLFFDYDNDGDQDLFVGFGFASSHLFENRLIPEGSFSMVEKSLQILNQQLTICLCANVFDFNRDGKNDLIVGNTLPPYLRDYPKSTPFNIFNLPKAEYKDDRRMLHFMHESWHDANNGGENFLLLNQGHGVFTEPNSKLIGLPETRWSLSIGSSDIDGDGYTDLYIANDFGHDDCYKNVGGKSFIRMQGNFHGELGLDTYKGMNSSLGDFDGNGQEDIYVSNVHHSMQAEGSLLWLNFTKPMAAKFDLKERAAPMNMLNINRFGWGAASIDINLDGRPDLLQANGMVDDSWDQLYKERSDYWYFQAQIARTGPEIHSFADKWADLRGRCIYENEADGVFLNLDGKRFVDVSNSVGFTHKANTRGIAAVDFDNDGDPDILVTDQFGEPKLYENKITPRLWLGIELVGNGKTTAKDPVGAKVWLSFEQNGQPQTTFREYHAVNGFSAQGDNRMLFALGKPGMNIKNLRLKVQWMDGRMEEYKNLTLNHYHKISEK